MSFSMASLSVIISMTALGVSFFTLWIVHLRRGDLKMTQPTMLFLGRDQGPPTPKVWMRTLLFSTSVKGQIIENMFLRVHAPAGRSYAFDFWAYSEKEKISRGSGLFVGQSGVVCDNHFMLRREITDFKFSAGDYRAEVFASVLGKPQPQRLMQVKFTLDKQQAEKMDRLTDAGIFFDWNPETSSYVGHLESRTQKTLEVWERFGQNLPQFEREVLKRS